MQWIMGTMEGPLETNIQIFSNPQFGEIRTAQTEEGGPLFCLADLCRILDLTNAGQVKPRLNEKGITTNDTLTNGEVQKMIYVNESNLYKVVFQSRKPEAEDFAEWVTSEVLPSIRKNGGYIMTKDDDSAELILSRVCE